MWVIGTGRGGRFPSKKDIKTHVALGKSLDFINTDMVGPDAGHNYTSESLPVGKEIAFVGPSEYERKFYGTVVVKLVKGERKVVVR